jgi:hypoxanthine phosphoribosyltransferase
LARSISLDYRDKDLILIGVLNGAFIFMADLVKNLTLPVQIDFVRLASYGSRTQSQGKIRMTKCVELPLAGKEVLVVEDIVDTGLTLEFLRNQLEKEGPKSIRFCALIDKKERRQVPIKVDYTGFRVTEGFIVGYGLDFNEQYRNLPALYHLQF